MEYRTDAPPPTIDMTAVDIHMPPPKMIEAIHAQAAQYERRFLYPGAEKDPPPERTIRGFGWYACHN